MIKNFSKVLVKYIPFRGGADSETPPLSTPDGFLRESNNVECDVNGGYSVIVPYERFDGRPSPSDAAYATISITLTGAISTGDTITGVTSGATAVVLSNLTTSLVVTKLVGSFVSGETLNVSAAAQATTTSVSSIDGASTAKLHAQYKNLAADNYRSDIGTVTGSGNILGVFQFNNVVYCFRNNAGGTAAVLWKSSSSGWTAVTMFNEVSFTAGGTSAPAEGSTLTQGANTATIKRVVLTSGTWAGGTAAGRLIVTTPAPADFAAGAATVGAISLTLSGVQTAITLSPSGSYEFDTYNFTGSASTIRVYGADGVNKGFEFDGTVYVPISTGMTTDTPTHVRGHKNHLFFSFASSVQHSSIGFPYQWSVVTGAAELGIGDTVTGFMPQSGSETNAALAIFSKNRIAVMYGTSSANWNIVEYLQETGAFAKTIQHLGFTVMLDDRGLTSLRATQDYGNFSSKTLSRNIRSWLNDRITTSTGSCINRNKTQYRLFFADNSGVYMTLEGNKVIGITPVLFKHSIECVHSSEKTDGTEVTYFGSDNGYVYQLDKGTSFDGDTLNYNFTTSISFFGSPRTRKRFRRAVYEIQGNGYAEFSHSYELSYNSSTITQQSAESVVTNLTEGRWDTGTWDVLFWDGVTLTPSEALLSGTADNIAIKVTSDNDYFQPITFSGVLIHYSMRRQLR